MNRFHYREYSQFKNFVVSTYLSYLGFYRPKYFILENVRNFASFKKSMVLRLFMRSMIKLILYMEVNSEIFRKMVLGGHYVHEFVVGYRC